MDEYISRKELRKHLKECYGDELFDPDMKKAVFGIDIYIENMPSADVQPVRHGRWINEGFLDMYCSNCGETPDSESGNCPTPTDYCPYCGTRMDSDSDGR